MSSVQDPVSSVYTGWLIGIPCSWIVIILNILDSTIQELIINQGFEHGSCEVHISTLA